MGYRPQTMFVAAQTSLKISAGSRYAAIGRQACDFAVEV
jgi:hypothetical protein